MNSKVIFCCICLFFVVSCEYHASMSGKIMDKETGKPLSGATVNLLEGGDIMQTNADGYFEVFTRPRGSINPKIVVTKRSYKPFELEISRSSDKIFYSVKTETKWVEFDEPLYLIPKDTNSITNGIDIEKWSQSFTAGSDTLLIYLSKDDEKVEVAKIKKEMIKNWQISIKK